MPKVRQLQINYMRLSKKKFRTYNRSSERIGNNFSLLKKKTRLSSGSKLCHKKKKTKLYHPRKGYKIIDIHILNVVLKKFEVCTKCKWTVIELQDWKIGYIENWIIWATETDVQQQQTWLDSCKITNALHHKGTQNTTMAIKNNNVNL